MTKNKMEVQTAMIPELEQELRSIFGFWKENAIDKVNGGFVAELDGEGNSSAAQEKGVVLNARILWTFSAAFNFSHDRSYLAIADRAFEYLKTYFWDKANGGLFWSVDLIGRPNNRRKQAYAQGFGIYGFSEYYKATNNKESLDYAIQLYNLIEQNYSDAQYGGYIEALGHNWQVLEDMRLSDKDANEPKSMNTHLHIIEPYTNLYRVWPNNTLKTRIQEQIAIFRDKIIDNKTYHFNLFFDMDWTVKSSIISYGHDIEGAWLLTEAAQVINDKTLLAEMKQLSLKMVDVTMNEGFGNDGSIFYEKENDLLDKDKHWWPQAEALVGLIDAFQNSTNQKYLEAAHKVWQFIITKIKDNTNGEWYWKVDENNNPCLNSPKVGFWKCPYHNSRAIMEVIKRINSLS